MTQPTVKRVEIPIDLYKRLNKLCTKNNRKFSEQLATILEEAIDDWEFTSDPIHIEWEKEIMREVERICSKPD
jgi:hypothetical protein